MPQWHTSKAKGGFMEHTDKIPALPRPGKILREKKPEDFLNDLADLKHRLDYFKYTDSYDNNDLREGYLQFMDDSDRFLGVFREIILDITEAMDYYNSMVEHVKALERVAKQYRHQHEVFHAELLDQGIDPIDPLSTARVIEQEIDSRYSDLKRRKENLDKVEEEIAITADVLAKAKSEMELALQHRYTLTDKQKLTLLEEKDKILDGIEQWGSISGALSHDRTIKSKASTIMLYCQKFPEFGEAIKVSQHLFKDRLEALMVERAIEGTENPVFGKGEHIGDYKIKNDKLFMELMKAKVPEEYNKKAVETVKNQQINNMNIISFANVDETKDGFTKDVGVVLDVDDTGRVQRITQEKKMREFYEKKNGATIIEPEDKEDGIE